MKHIEFCMKALIVVVALTLAAGEVNANTGMKQTVGLSQGGSIGEISLRGRYAVSAAIGRDRDVFHVKTTGTDLEAINPSQSLTARFSSSGVEVSMGGHDLGLAIRGYGYGEDLKPVSPGRPVMAKNRVEYNRGALTEWYVNGPFGLQQGFTLDSAPSNRNDGTPLTLCLSLRGDLRGVVEKDRKGLILSSTEGTAVMRYGGLIAIDADGREAPAWMEAKGDHLFLMVDDTDARYPLMIDPFIQTAKLTASDGAASDYFGISVSTSGDTIVVGAYQADIGPNGNQGSAYVFVKPGSGWTTTSAYTAKLTTSDGAAFDFFGWSVSVSGDTIVVGAHSEDIGIGINRGSAYVFVKPGGGWATTSTYTAKLTASDGAALDEFGYSVSVSGDTVVVGARGDDDNGADSGSAYIFGKGAGWTDMTQTAKLTADDGATLDEFGCSVSISGDTAVIGARYDDDDGTNSGSAYVFEKGAGWGDMTQTAKLTAGSDGATSDFFGWSVSVSGDTIVVGAYQADIGPNGNQGSAYVFVKPGSGWTTTSAYTAKLTTSDGAAFDFFGWSVSVSGDTIVVGACGDDDNGTHSGSAYVFVKPGGGWGDMTQTTKLTASDGAAGDEFGISVSVSGDTVVVGAHFDDSIKGSAYIFNDVGAAPIPTLSQWGMIIFMGLLLLSSIAFIKRRRG